jgi:hypothetical protein
MNKLNLVNVTQDDFEMYEDVRTSGLFNMLDARARNMSGLSKPVYFAIITNYSLYKEKFN